MEDREKRIQSAIEKSKHKWDEKYSQEAWVPKQTQVPDSNRPDDKWKRTGGMRASKAMKNLY